MANITLFAQVIRLIPREIIQRLVKKHGTDKHAKGFNSWSHLVTMIFSQFSGSVSLRQISEGLQSATGNLNHLGLSRAPSKSNISYQNTNRTSQFFKDVFYALFQYLGQHGGLKQMKKPLKAKICLLDSTLMSLCLSMYDWVLYTHTKGAVKMHTVLDFETLLPEFVCITNGKGADNTIAKKLHFARGTIVVADRIYSDTELLNHWDSTGGVFIVRGRDNIQFESIWERDLPDTTSQEILKDEEVRLTGVETASKYPKKIRRIGIYNVQGGYTIDLYTNDFKHAASTIAALYRSRWKIEIFFRNLKQNLHIKSFLGTSQNAVEIQIWTALITILLLQYLKRIAKHTWCLSNLTASLRLNTFTKIDLFQWINEPFSPPPDEPEIA